MIKMNKQRHFDVSFKYSRASWGVLGCPGVIRLIPCDHIFVTFLNLNSLLVKRQTDNPSPGAVTGGN